jgi:hypothetical protein
MLQRQAATIIEGLEFCGGNIHRSYYYPGVPVPIQFLDIDYFL